MLPDQAQLQRSDWFKGFAILVLSVCMGAFVVGTLHWPLVNDAAYQHYVVFLLEHHEAPYRTVIDYQLPGTYFVNWAVMRTLGAGGYGWRAYDFFLLVVAGVAMWHICRPYGRFAGFYAGALFALFHARDGIGQTGQRDLAIAALLLAGVAFLLCDKRRRTVGPVIFGLCVGFAITLKPTAALFLVCAAFVPLGERRAQDFEKARDRRIRLRSMALGTAAALVGPGIALLWVIHMGSLGAFWLMLTEFLPLHARLGSRGIISIMRLCFTPSIGVLAAITALLLLFRRHRCRSGAPGGVRALLLAGVFCGLASYFIQMQGFPYHRYPALAFLFPLAAIELNLALDASGWRRWVGYGGLLFGVALAPIYTSRALRARWLPVPASSLENDLTLLARPEPVASLDEEVQCIDSISGCIAVLNRLQPVQATGQLQDELLMAPRNKETVSEQVAVAKTRRTFLDELQRRPPRVIVVSQWLFPAGPDEFEKLERWPELQGYLKTCYALLGQRLFSRSPNGPAGYRLYVRRAGCAAMPGARRLGLS